MKSSDREYDDLKVFKQIREARERFLRESLKVVTYQDLAALTADEIKTAFQAAGKSAPKPEFIEEQWIDEARKRAAAAELSSQPNAESEVLETGATANSPAVDGKWGRIATFVVVFERRGAGRLEEHWTTVEQQEKEDGADIGNWPGIESERLCQWMLDRVGEELQPELEEELPVEEPVAVEIPAEAPPEAELPVEEPVAAETPAEAPPAAELPAEEPVAQNAVRDRRRGWRKHPAQDSLRDAVRTALAETPAEAPPAAAFPVTVTYGQLRALQPPQAETPSAIAEAGQLFLGSVKGNQPFAVEAHFELTGPAAATAAKEQKTYYVQFIARNLRTRETKDWVTGAQSLVEGELSYTAVLPEAALPPGRYRLRALATIEGTLSTPYWLEVPLLQVV